MLKYILWVSSFQGLQFPSMQLNLIAVFPYNSFAFHDIATIKISCCFFRWKNMCMPFLHLYFIFSFFISFFIFSNTVEFSGTIIGNNFLPGYLK